VCFLPTLCVAKEKKRPCPLLKREREEREIERKIERGEMKRRKRRKKKNVRNEIECDRLLNIAIEGNLFI
jgi:hypothetical protein